MKRNSFLILGMLLNLLSFNAVASEQTAQSVRTVTYTADNTSIFPNPERGFYEEVEWRGTDNLDDYYFEEGTQKGRSLLMRLYYFENYRTTDLPQSVLTQIGNDMAEWKTKVGTNTENSTVCRSAAKRVENGQILIERNGNTYNAIGERIR